MRVFRSLAPAAVLVLAIPSAGWAGQASTTRIETRPFYGATVTLESGVRVFRPLPPHERVIINPGGRTPLTLSFEENRTYNYDRTGSAREPIERGASEPSSGAPFYGAAQADDQAERVGSKRNPTVLRQRFAPAGAGPATQHGVKP